MLRFVHSHPCALEQLGKSEIHAAVPWRTETMTEALTGLKVFQVFLGPSTRCIAGPWRDYVAFTEWQMKIPVNSQAEDHRWAVTYCSCNKSMPAARSLKKPTAMVYNTRIVMSYTSCPRPIHAPQTSFFPVNSPIPGTHHYLVERTDWNLSSPKLDSLFLPRKYSNFIYIQASRQRYTHTCIYKKKYLPIWEFLSF